MKEGPFQLEITSDPTQIEQLWGDAERPAAFTPFQSRGWLLPLYRTLAERLDAAPMIVTVTHVHAGLVMMLPLCIRKEYTGRVVQFADFGTCDYNGPILREDFLWSPDLVRRLLGQLKAALRDCDLLWLKKMPRRINGSSNPLLALPRVREMPVKSWAVSLPGSEGEFREKFLTPTFRKELERKRRRITQRGRVAFSYASTPEERLALFETLYRQRQARCEEMGRSHMLSEPGYQDFYKAVLACEHANRFAAIGGLYVNGNAVATAFSLHDRRGAYVLMTTFESGPWKSCSLGNLVIDECVRHSIERHDTFLDLTIGDEPYKRDYGATPTPLFSLIAPLSMKGWFMSLGLSGASRLARLQRVEFTADMIAAACRPSQRS